MSSLFHSVGGIGTPGPPHVLVDELDPALAWSAAVVPLTPITCRLRKGQRKKT
jgi:hypothetical protein